MAEAFLAMLAAAPVPGAEPEYSVGDVLALFADTCRTAEDPARTAAAATAAGWQRLAADADEPVSRLARQAERALKEEAPDASDILGSEYRKVVNGRAVYLAISRAKSSGAMAYGCRVYDFAAPRSPTAGELEKWAGRPPESSLAPRGVTKFTWSPGLSPAQSEMQVIYASPGSRPVLGFETGGLALVASALEF